MAGGDDGETALFAGVDDTTRSDGGEVVENDQPPLAGSMPVSVTAWMKDLTYREVHAFTFGFVPWFLGVVSSSSLLVAAGVGVVLVATYGQSTRRFASVPKYVLKEPHYAQGGAFIAYVLASLALGLMSVLTAWAGVLGW